MPGEKEFWTQTGLLKFPHGLPTDRLYFGGVAELVEGGGLEKLNSRRFKPLAHLSVTNSTHKSNRRQELTCEECVLECHDGLRPIFNLASTSCLWFQTHFLIRPNSTKPN